MEMGKWEVGSKHKVSTAHLVNTCHLAKARPLLSLPQLGSLGRLQHQLGGRVPSKDRGGPHQDGPHHQGVGEVSPFSPKEDRGDTALRGRPQHCAPGLLGSGAVLEAKDLALLLQSSQLWVLH